MSVNPPFEKLSPDRLHDYLNVPFDYLTYPLQENGDLIVGLDCELTFTLPANKTVLLRDLVVWGKLTIQGPKEAPKDPRPKVIFHNVLVIGKVDTRYIDLEADFTYIAKNTRDFVRVISKQIQENQKNDIDQPFPDNPKTILPNLDPSRWLEFLKIPLCVERPLSNPNKDLYIGLKDKFNLRPPTGSTLRFRNIVVLGELTIAPDKYVRGKKIDVYAKSIFFSGIMNLYNVELFYDTCEEFERTYHFREQLLKLYFGHLDDQDETVGEEKKATSEKN